MNKTKILLASTLIMTAFSATPALAKSKASAKAESAKSTILAVDPAQSSVKWLGKKVTGQHSGTIALKSGTVEVEKGTLKGGQFEVDMPSIKNEDITDAENNAKLTGHLKSDDFFGVSKFPVASFKITSVKALKDQKDATHEITGDLTIKGVTHPVTFPATVEIKGDKASAKGKVTIDRTKYDIKYGSGKFFENLGDKMINDTFELELDLKSKT